MSPLRRRSGARQALDWLFRSRRTGRVVLVQMPNVPLWIFIMASLLRRVFRPEGAAGAAVNTVADISILLWAGLEVARGVNPFRRLLGAGVAVSVLAPLVLTAF